MSTKPGAPFRPSVESVQDSGKLAGAVIGVASLIGLFAGAIGSRGTTSFGSDYLL